MRARTTVTLLEPQTKVDRYFEDPVPDWDEEPTEHENVPAAIEPVSSDEAAVTADTIVSRWQCFLPGDTPATPSWRVRWRGDDYDIDSEVTPWEGRGRVRYRTCLLKRVSG